MSDIKYSILINDAVLLVIKKVLKIVEKSGSLPGEHHFFIEFDTKHKGVKISDALRVKYKDRMKIVIQHQFYNLTVDNTKFSVQLVFNKVRETLVIPFAAIVSFTDPGGDFNVNLNQDDDYGEDVDDILDYHDHDDDNTDNKIISLDDFRK